jgi:hypothetical protein
MGLRSVPTRGRTGAKGAIPAGLLLLGMVEEPAAPEAPAKDEEVPAPKKGRGRKAAAKDGAEPKESKAKKAAARKPRAKKEKAEPAAT